MADEQETAAVTEEQVNPDVQKEVASQPEPVATKKSSRTPDDSYRLVEDKTVEEPGCLGSSGQGIRSYWSTRELEMIDGGRVKFIKTTLVELFIYIIFLILLSCVAYFAIVPYVFYYTSIISVLFTDSSISPNSQKTFRTISRVDEFWEFLNNSLLDNIYWEISYMGRNLTDEEIGYIYYENRILGVPRLRQLRVQNNTCAVPDVFKELITSCYSVYSTSNEDQEKFGKDDATFTYENAEKLGGLSHWGIISTYDGGGYVQDLHQRKRAARELLKVLFDGEWINRGTRAVFIDLTVYNANLNLFCVIRLLGEFPASGGVITSSTFFTVKLLRYESSGDKIVGYLELGVGIFILYYLIEEFMEICALKSRYFARFWNYIDLCIIIIAVITALFNFSRTSKVDAMLDDVTKNSKTYMDFQGVAYWQMVFNSALAIMVFLAWVKVFKYLTFNKSMTQLSSTLSRCSKDLFGFAIMFFIVFLAFANLGYLVFGTQSKGFSTFADSIFTLFRIILGDFDFSALEQANRILGPMFFVLYVFFVFFVLLNMFLAIINDTYSQVKATLDKENIGFHTTDYIKMVVCRLFNVEPYGKDSIGPKDCGAWELDMLAQGYAREHVAALVSKYCDKDTILKPFDQKQMQDELEEMSKGYFRDEESQFVAMQFRLNNMQKNLTGFAEKIEEALVRFTKSEKQKVHRAAAMSRLLDAIVQAQNSDDKKLNQIEMMIKEELERIS